MSSVRPDSTGRRAEFGAISCAVELPRDFRVEDVLSFHRRDAQQVAEQIDAYTLHKGISWGGHPARLSIRFNTNHADAELRVDGPRAKAMPASLQKMTRHMLGLTQPVEEFERQYRKHPQLGPMIKQRPGLRVPQSATRFEALSWAITGQQISVSAAVSVRRRLIDIAGMKHSSGIACYPDADRVADLSETELRTAGYSQAKAQTLMTLSRLIAAGKLPLDTWLEAPPVDEVRERLTAIRGIGPWTVNYALLRGFGYLDGSLHGDVAVRRGLQTLLKCREKITEQEAQRWLASFSPWRALVAAHLWALPLPSE